MRVQLYWIIINRQVWGLNYINNIEYVYNIHRSEATYLKNVKTSYVKSLLKIHCASWGEGGGGGGNPYDGLYEEAPPKRGIFSLGLRYMKG